MKHPRITIIAILAVLMASSGLVADVYMKQNQHTDAFEVMGQKQEAQDLVTEIWIGKDKIVSSNAENGFILRLDIVDPVGCD